jgi:transketolase
MIKDTHRRILELSYRHKLAHIGSCISSVDIIDDIYSKKDINDIFIISNGHAGLALYVILEKYESKDAEELLKKHGVHPNKDISNSIYCSSGSLGLAITIAVGFALADKNRTICCLISDGEAYEGSVWESLNFIEENQLKNIEIHVNANGYSAYKNTDYIIKKLMDYTCVNLHKTNFKNINFLNGLDAHYYIMAEEDHKLCLEI